MQKVVRNRESGFSLVELLAVVLIMAVLAAVAIPLYVNTRKSAAARSCKGNIAAIAAAQSAYALRNTGYSATVTGLVGQPEGLADTPFCPLDGDAYTNSVDAGTGILTISCPNVADHQAVVTGTYSQTMAKPAAETIP